MIIVFTQTPEEHLHRLKAVFNKFEAAGLKLKPSKCGLFKQQINYLGHVVSNEGVSTDPEKIKIVTEWPQPTTVTEVRSFLGFVSYYRRLIPNFSQVAKPLNKLLQTLVDTQKRVIAYASQSLSRSERNYPFHKLEFLALKWAITDKFHKYLYGSEFQVYMDNNPLAYVLTMAKLDATGHRWVAALSNYTFSIICKPGKGLHDADALSCIKWAKAMELDSQAVQAVCEGVEAPHGKIQTLCHKA